MKRDPKLEAEEQTLVILSLLYMSRAEGLGSGMHGWMLHVAEQRAKALVKTLRTCGEAEQERGREARRAAAAGDGPRAAEGLGTAGGQSPVGEVGDGSGNGHAPAADAEVSPGVCTGPESDWGV